jgi:heme/copper-type cytochrome/quinol oxidase subunit 2
MKNSTIKKVSFITTLVVLCVGFVALVDYFASNMKDAPSYMEAYNAVGSVLLIPFMLIAALVVYYFDVVIDEVAGDDE